MSRFSCIIPAKDENDPLLAELIKSIRGQIYHQDSVEIIVVTEGDSESAKAIGIRKAKGEILCMLCADNYLLDPFVFTQVDRLFRFLPDVAAIYSRHYAYKKDDNSLNRYFALTGVNDPVALYLGKNDRLPYYAPDDNELFSFLEFKDRIPSFGDNGFFVKASYFKNTNLDHYYPMDNCEDMRKKGGYLYARLNKQYIWHRTAESLWSFLKKRFKYARDLYCRRTDRRWKMVDTPKDWFFLFLFVLQSLTILPTLALSIRGYMKKPDIAWFWHPIVCFSMTIMYIILWIKHYAFRSLSRH